MKENIEEAVLGCLLIKPDLGKSVIISQEHFLNPENKKMFEIFIRQYGEYKTISPVGILENYKTMFKDSKEIDNFLLLTTDLMDQNIFPYQFDYYQKTLFRKYLDNKLSYEILKFQKDEITQEELLNSIHEIERETIKDTDTNLTADEIYRLISMQNKRINFGFQRLSKHANIQEHDLVIIAARPGIGKTGFAVNLIENLSNTYNTILFNMEMTEQQVYRRLVAINSNIPISYHENPATEHQKQQLIASCKNISNKKIKVITGGQTIRTIKSRIIKESSKEHTIIFIDYIGLIRDVVKNRSSYERVTEIVKELRQISLDYNCTIFCLAQINRNSEKEKDKRPKISDLKESGELEQSATTVLMLHNEGYYKNVQRDKEELEIIIGKNRNGVTGIVEFYYNPSNQKFEEKRSY